LVRDVVLDQCVDVGKLFSIAAFAFMILLGFESVLFLIMCVAEDGLLVQALLVVPVGGQLPLSIPDIVAQLIVLRAQGLYMTPAKGQYQ
jgi:hypothetical protein